MVIRNASQSDFAKNGALLRHGRGGPKHGRVRGLDGRLHETIALAAHNSLVTHVFQLINQACDQDDWGALKRRSLTPEKRQSYQAEHRQLVNALADRDLERAINCTREHLLHVRRNLLGS
jgi:DNA-binding FadR family transcriptional regulator